MSRGTKDQSKEMLVFFVRCKMQCTDAGGEEERVLRAYGGCGCTSLVVKCADLSSKTLSINTRLVKATPNAVLQVNSPSPPWSCLLRLTALQLFQDTG